MNQRTAAGDRYGYVGEAIDADWTPEQEQPRARPVEPPRLPDRPAFPKPGVYFGMSDEVYHAIHAGSCSGLKSLSLSGMDYWVRSPLNPDKQERQSKFLDYGKAIHCFVLEGEEVYQRRYAVMPEPADYSDQPVLFSSDEVKAAIAKFTHLAPVSPAGSTKQVLLDQLVALGAKHSVEVDREGTVPQLRERIKAFEEEQPVSPVSRVVEGEASRAAVKDDWIDQLLALDPAALIWDRIVAEHEKANPGLPISAQDDRRIRVASKMILAHPDIGPRFSDGFPEVAVFWYCPKTGLAMKAKFDWLRLGEIADLKSFSNKNQKPINRAIETTIANYHYNLQHAVYVEGAVEARKAIAEHGAEAVFIHPLTDPELAERQMDFALDWAKEQEPPEFLFIFQQSGPAPVTRGRTVSREGWLYSTTCARLEELKRDFVAYSEVFGVEAWLDNEPVEMLDEDRVPPWATEIGRIEA